MSVRQGRTLVLCFDGTTNKYSENNTNVSKFYSLLRKDDQTQQLCYYQAGIGTYFDPGVVQPAFDLLGKVADMAIAWYLSDHVMDGYKFLMQNYKAGDKICVFGFSRGAYTARALAGMLYKVGLLSKDNFEQVPFAYKFYEQTDKDGDKLCSAFKHDYCTDVQLEFVGVWDTVASVGIILGRDLPFTDSNTAIRTFRHAMSLDEHRSRFRANQFHRTSSPRDHRYSSTSSYHVSKTQKRSSSVSTVQSSVDQASETAQGDAESSILEVWFTGTHCDVGGGILPTNTRRALCNIPFRWMVREVMRSSCGIQFDEDALLHHNIPIGPMEEHRRTEEHHHHPGEYRHKEERRRIEALRHKEELRLNTLDAREPIHDDLWTLWLCLFWWILEIVPMHFMWQDANDQWHLEYNIHLGRGRDIHDPAPKFHITVKQRMDDPNLDYSPNANWIRGTETYVE